MNVVATPALRGRLLERTAGDRRRAILDRVMRALCLVAAVLCIIPLAAIIGYVVINGIQALTADLVTKPPTASGKNGGALNAILGSIQMVGLASIIAIPIGVLGGVFVHEFSDRRSARAIRFSADVFVGVPSILVGIFVFTILVLPFKQYNAFAGAVALAFIMIPVIMRSTEEILRLVPGSLREASLALGVPVWRTVASVILRTGLPGILTGVMLAVARAAGETAPLLFTALGSRLVNIGDFSKPMDALPLFIYNNARQPFPILNQQAWGAALLLLIFVLTVNILVRARTWRQRSA